MFNFPWTNFHELNLDWILSVVKEAKAVFDNGRADIDYAVSTADEAKTIATQAAEASIADNSVSTIKIQNGAVTNSKLANNSVTTANIVDRTIIGNDIAENTIESYNIKNGTIIGADIAENTITYNNLAVGAVVNSKISDGAITNVKIADGTICYEKLNGINVALLEPMAESGAYSPGDTITLTKNLNNYRFLVILLYHYSFGSASLVVRSTESKFSAFLAGMAAENTLQILSETITKSGNALVIGTQTAANLTTSGVSFFSTANMKIANVYGLR